MGLSAASVEMTFFLAESPRTGWWLRGVELSVLPDGPTARGAGTTCRFNAPFGRQGVAAGLVRCGRAGKCNWRCRSRGRWPRCRRPSIGSCGRNDVAGDDGRGDARDLVGEVDDAADGADAAARGDERRDGPSDRRRCGEAADGDADPDQGAGGGVGVGRAEDTEAAGGSADEHGLADAAGVPAALDEGVGEPAADEIGERGEEPGDAGVEEGVEKVDMQRGGEIARQPGEQQIEDVVVGAEANGEAEDFALAEEIAE